MIDFSKEEKDLIRYFAKRGEWRREVWSFYGVILLPLLAFAVYGLVRQDTVAIGIAFFGLFLAVLWHIFSQAQYSRLWRSICEKLKNHFDRTIE